MDIEVISTKTYLSEEFHIVSSVLEENDINIGKTWAGSYLHSHNTESQTHRPNH